MKTIFKYVTQFNSNTDGTVHRAEFEAPANARPISAAVQAGKHVLWVEVSPTQPLKKQFVYVIGTGQALPPITTPIRFLGTVIDGEHVWHIYAPGD